MKARVGLWIAIAALGVNAPRLVQAFLEADGLRLHEPLRPWLMGATGVAAALTLTGGGAWLAHELARGSYQQGGQQGGRLQGVLMSCWVMVLVGQLVLLPPLLMTEMADSRLGSVLTSGWQRWSWAFTAVFLVELVAAGAMVAQGRRSLQAEARASELAELEQLAFQRADLEQRLEARDREVSELKQQLAEVTPPSAEPRRLSRRKKSRSPQLKEPTGRVACRNGCGWVGRSRQAEYGHQRACELREGQP